MPTNIPQSDLDIREDLNTIESASYGYQVRDALVSALKTINGIAQYLHTNSDFSSAASVAEAARRTANSAVEEAMRANNVSSAVQRTWSQAALSARSIAPGAQPRVLIEYSYKEDGVTVDETKPARITFEFGGPSYLSPDNFGFFTGADNNGNIMSPDLFRRFEYGVETLEPGKSAYAKFVVTNNDTEYPGCEGKIILGIPRGEPGFGDADVASWIRSRPAIARVWYNAAYYEDSANGDYEFSAQSCVGNEAGEKYDAVLVRMKMFPSKIYTWQYDQNKYIWATSLETQDNKPTDFDTDVWVMCKKGSSAKAIGFNSFGNRVERVVTFDPEDASGKCIRISDIKMDGYIEGPWGTAYHKYSSDGEGAFYTYNLYLAPVDIYGITKIHASEEGIPEQVRPE